MKVSSSTLLLNMIFLLASSFPVQTKVLIFTYAYNRPEFIELQYKTFCKFLLDDHELVVFNDAREKKMQQQISDICQKYYIRCIPIPQEIHDRPYLDRSTEIKHWVLNEYNAPSVRNCNVVQYSLDYLGFKHNDIVILFESDIFLIKEFSFYQYLKNYDLAGYNRSVEYQGKQKDIDLLWIGLIFINMKTLPNKTMFNTNCGSCSNVIVDSGGHTHYYINNNPLAHIKFFDKIQIQSYYCATCEKEKSYRCFHNTSQLSNLGFDDRTIEFIQAVPIDWGSGVTRPDKIDGIEKRNIEFLVNNNFVHFYGASGYANNSTFNFDIKQFYKDKVDVFLYYINDILE